jgi:hypothetical protein
MRTSTMAYNPNDVNWLISELISHLANNFIVGVVLDVEVQ